MPEGEGGNCFVVSLTSLLRAGLPIPDRTCLIAGDAADPKSRTRRSGSLPFLFTWRTAQAGRDALCRVPGILRPSALGCPVHSHPFEKIPPSTPPQASPAFTQPRISLESVLFAKTPLNKRPELIGSEFTAGPDW